MAETNELTVSRALNTGQSRARGKQAVGRSSPGRTTETAATPSRYVKIQDPDWCAEQLSKLRTAKSWFVLGILSPTKKPSFPSMSRDARSITNTCALAKKIAVIAGRVSLEVSEVMTQCPTLRHTDSALF
jgi:hypothetical protein